MSSWRILAPHDGSKQARKALKKAIELSKLVKAGLNNVEINMLYVVPEIYVPFRLFDRDINIKSIVTGDRLTTQQYLKEFYHEMKSKTKTMLETQKKEQNGTSDIDVKTYVIYGHPSDKILEFAEKHHIDLIVMGSTGLSGFSKLKALGSVARDVSERAKCPVMIVH
jgi:nucleotide-binding universal stress UspA family protein